MINSAAYSIIKALIEEDLLVIEYQGLVEWVDRLKSRGEIWEEEIEDLLQLADQRQIYDIPGSEFVSSEKLPVPGGMQDHKVLLQIASRASIDGGENSTERLRNFIDKYLGYWALNSTILGIGISFAV